VKQYAKPDFWALKAQKEGYPARSVYKLLEIDTKFHLLDKAHAVLDMGAAPGSWSLCLLRKRCSTGTKGSDATPAFSLTACDLSPLSRQYDKGLFDSPAFHFVQGDFTTEAIRTAIVANGPFDLIVSDAAPATSGNRSLDTLRSAALVESVLDYAGKYLALRGNLIVKIFQGEGSAEIMQKMKALFKTVKSFKPEACRANSFEIYYIGMERKND
jgi:23S rRNA (uridine2552-2'-O)-methyltransferase